MLVAAERAPWQNPRILSTLVLVFLAGASSGALSMRMGLHEKLHRTPSHESSRDALLQKFKTQLDLSSTQTEKLSLVLDDYSQYYQSLQDQLDDLRATGKSRILQILNPDQRAKFQKVMTDLAPDLSAGGGAK
jgi:Spy/CpxP family protein refolding chaperone